MAEVHHFTYGVFNPIAAFLLAFLGSFFGLLCTGRARAARTPGRRNRWLVIAAFAIGGAALWLMHFAAMLGFDVPASPVRYDLAFTLLSLVLAVLSMGAGLLIVGHGRRRAPKTLAAGLLSGAGLLAMHYTGMHGLHVSGVVRYNLGLEVASALVAVAAATTTLWFAASVNGYGPITAAAAVIAAAVCGMHYLGMAAMSVRLSPVGPGGVSGIRPLTMIVPITLISAATIVGVAMSALQAMTEEEFTDGAGVPRRGVHAGTSNPWSLKQASMTAVGRAPGPRPSPRPLGVRTSSVADRVGS